MFETIFFAFWFFLPAGVANLAAFVSGKIDFLKKFNYPVDFYATFHGKRVLGSHKTVRGFFVAILVGILICYLEVYFYTKVFGIRQLVSLDYYTVNPVLLGTLLGLGALTGDAVKSFFKRQIGIKPGKSWFPFDQIDYIIGGVVFTGFYIQLAFVAYIDIFVVWFLLHPLATCLGYLFRLRHKPL